jgi:hypothetical protein
MSTLLKVYPESVKDTPVDVDVQLKFNELGSKSALIRYYQADGKKRGEIAKLLGIRYQHVRNVQVQQPKRTELL